MSDWTSVVFEEVLLVILKDLFEDTLNSRIANANTEHGDQFMPTFQTVERKDLVVMTCRRPAVFYSLNWANKRIIDDFIERAEYFLTVRMIFDDFRPPCLGFRYAALLKDLLINGVELNAVCDQVVMDHMDYRMSDDEGDGEPSEAEFRIRLIRESF